MATLIDRKAFFKAMRAMMGGVLTAKQVEGTEALLDAWERYGDKDLRKLAYVLATARGEVGKEMFPYIESQSMNDKTRPSIEQAIARLESSWKRGRLKWVKTPYWRKDSRGRSWLGRGYAQITHLANYERVKKETGHDVVNNPDLLFNPKIAAEATVKAMMGGWFTGKKLGHYFTAANKDWYQARRIINGMDRANNFAEFAKQFHNCLLLSVPAERLGVDIPIASVLSQEPPPEPMQKSGIALAQVASGGGAMLVGFNAIMTTINETVGSATESWGALIGYGFMPAWLIVAICLAILACAVISFYKRWRIKNDYGV